MVKSNLPPNRNRAIQEAIADKLKQLKRIRLAQECSKHDSDVEQNMAEEGISTEIDEWLGY